MSVRSALTILLIVIVQQIFAQDTICKINGKRLIGKIVSKDINAIRYRPQENPDTIFSVNKSEVIEVRYKTGKKEMIYHEIEEEKAEKFVLNKFDNPERTPHILQTSVLAPFFDPNHILICYVFHKDSAKFVPGISIGFWPVPKDLFYSVEPELRYYFYRSKYAKYTIGPKNLGVGVLRAYTGPVFRYSKVRDITADHTIADIFIVLGLQFELSRGFCLNAAGGLGYGSDVVNGVKTKGSVPYFEICAGKRF